MIRRALVGALTAGLMLVFTAGTASAAPTSIRVRMPECLREPGRLTYATLRRFLWLGCFESEARELRNQYGALLLIVDAAY